MKVLTWWLSECSSENIMIKNNMNLSPPLRRQISKHQLMFNLLTPEDLFSECFYQPDDAMSALLKE